MCLRYKLYKQYIAYGKIRFMENNVKKILIVGVACLAIFSLVFMFALDSNNKGESNETINNQTNNSIQIATSNSIPEANSVTNEITANMIVEQEFKCNLDSFNKLEIVFNKEYEYDEDDEDVPYLLIEVLDENDVLLAKNVEVRDIPNQHRLHVKVSKSINDLNNKKLILRITNNSKYNTGCALMYQENNKTSFMFGDKKINGTICFALVNE